MKDFLGAVVLHWAPEKAIWIGEHSLSWDARCAGIYIGFALGLLFHVIAEPRANRLSPFPVMFFLGGLFVPLFIDVGTVHWGLRSASNESRLLTGTLFGLAACAFLYPTAVASAPISGAHRAAIASMGRCAVLLALGAAPLFAARMDTVAVYYSLEGLAVLGNIALFAMAGLGPLLLLLSRRENNSR